MRLKRYIIFLWFITAFSCSKPEAVEAPINRIYPQFAPPSWIHGTWEQQFFGYEAFIFDSSNVFHINDGILTQFNINYQNRLNEYDSEGHLRNFVQEESDSMYMFRFDSHENLSQFKKFNIVNDTTIEYSIVYGDDTIDLGYFHKN